MIFKLLHEKKKRKVSLEVKLFEGEVRFHDARGLDASPQHVLLCGDVVGFGYPLQVIQVADRKTNILYLSGSIYYDSKYRIKQ